MAIMEICAKCGEEYNSDKWVNGAGTCQDCACDAMELENAALRARVEPLQAVHEAELGVCEKHCEVVAELKARVEKLEKAAQGVCKSVEFHHRNELAEDEYSAMMNPLWQELEAALAGCEEG